MLPDPAAQLRASLTRQSHALEAARVILTVFDAHQAQFRLITRRAEGRFRHRDWKGGQLDAAERLTLYRQFVSWCVTELRRVLGPLGGDTAFWRGFKDQYGKLASVRPDAELALTFYNSVTRQTIHAVGPGEGVYFDDADFQALTPVADPQLVRAYDARPGLELALRTLLADLPFADAMRRLEGQAAGAAQAIERDLAARDGAVVVERIELVPAPFYRNKAAYLVGRIVTDTGVMPLVMPVIHDHRGIAIDAVLTSANEVSIVFSFTRSYFHVELGAPRAMVEFLRSLLPLKPVDELYTSLGYHKHGKTELIRALVRQIRDSDDHFEPAPGDKGLVMTVFALPSLQVVFKVIKDRFGPPKHTTRQEVMEKYHLVFVRDRVGRLADAQEFEALEFRRDRFQPEVLEELSREAPSSIRLEDDRVVIRHLYTERLVTPLNLYLKSADEARAAEVVLDYGQAIKDLAAANIFTGDMLLKNFGVTRHGRVIFYDYDELCLLTDCNIREIPPPRDELDEMAAEPWFHVGERDVFPEEFRAFLTLPGRLGEVFLKAHADLLTVEFWRRMQRLAEAGEVVDFFPYKPARRLTEG